MSYYVSNKDKDLLHGYEDISVEKEHCQSTTVLTESLQFFPERSVGKQQVIYSLKIIIRQKRHTCMLWSNHFSCHPV